MKNSSSSCRAYFFDIDNNLTTKEALIVLQKNDHIVTVEWPEAKQLMEDGYTYPNGNHDEAFKYARDIGPEGGEAFPNYTTAVVQEKSIGPSFGKFIQAVSHAEIIGFNTSRGHAARNLQLGIQNLIIGLFTQEEKEKTHESILGRGWSVQSNFETALDEYLAEQIYAPVHHQGFMQEHGLTQEVLYHEKKARVMKYMVETAASIYKRRFAHIYDSLSIGFSDDDPNNIGSINAWGEQHREWLENQHIHFVTYHSHADQTIKKRLTTKKSA